MSHKYDCRAAEFTPTVNSLRRPAAIYHMICVYSQACEERNMCNTLLMNLPNHQARRYRGHQLTPSLGRRVYRAPRQRGWWDFLFRFTLNKAMLKTERKNSSTPTPTPPRWWRKTTKETNNNGDQKKKQTTTCGGRLQLCIVSCGLATLYRAEQNERKDANCMKIRTDDSEVP